MDLADETEQKVSFILTSQDLSAWSFLKNTFINNLENYELDLKTFEVDYHTWEWYSKCKN